MSNVHVRELTTEEEWVNAFPVMIQLWEDTPRSLTKGSFIHLVQELRTTESYRLFGLFVNEMVVALGGVAIHMNAWYGRYLWVYDLVTDADHRSDGFGNELLSFLKKWAKDHDCERIALASALGREDAHRFYENSEMEKSSYVFTRRLE